jgi:deoxycytidylate deaminase
MLVPYCHGRCRHVSFLVCRNKIESIGLNSYIKTSTKAAKYGHLGANIHSELAALVNARRQLDISRMTLYNVRIKTNGVVSLSAPCSCCTKLILAYNIRRVYYSTNDGTFEKMYI